MNKTVLRILEFDKICAHLAAEAGSSIAKERAENLLPAESLDEAKERLTATAAAVRILKAGAPPLGGIHDIRPAVKRASLGLTLELEELATIGQTLYAAKELKRFFAELDELIDAAGLCARAEKIEMLPQLARRIEETIDEHGQLKDSASPELMRISRAIFTNEQRIKDTLHSILHKAENQKIFQEAIVSMRGDRYVLPVKREYRQALAGIVHDQSATGATVFIEPLAVVERNNEIKELLIAKRREIERILSALSREIEKAGAILLANLDILAELDFTFAKAKYAQKLSATEPELNDGGQVKLKAARHPLIDPASVVPIDIRLGEAFRLLLVTGPNTGGKTVGMKTLGLLAVMAQAGLFIPAAFGSEISIYRQIYADIGDEQSIEQSLSTFSAHMKHIVYIVKRATAGDLILLDELGAGTDPAEGAALAVAVLEYLLKRGASIVATTHYSELKTFAYETPGVENACVEFDVKTLRPTYRLLIGLPGASNAFAISQRLGLAKNIVERAGTLLKAEHKKFETIVSELEEKRRLYEEQVTKVEEKKRRLEAKEAEMEKKIRQMTEKREEMLRQAKEESAGLIRHARQEATEIIKELKEQYSDQGKKKRQQAIEDARRRLNDASELLPGLGAKESDLAAYEQPVDIKTIAVGATVFVVPFGQKAMVSKVRGDEITVEIGAMLSTVRAADCRFVAAPADRRQKEAAKGETKQADILFEKARKAKATLDIRGSLVADGIEEVNKFLDTAALAGLKRVVIIHGKGTGQLRQGIQEHLSSHRAVSSYQFADADEGGSGATVVKLK